MKTGSKLLKNQSYKRSLLQRRNSLSNSFQALLDGLLVIMLTVALSYLYQDALTTQYMILAVTLLGFMAVVYDRFGIYRLHGSMTRKLMTLGKAWSISFALLFLLGFLTKSTDLFPASLSVCFTSWDSWARLQVTSVSVTCSASTWHGRSRSKHWLSAPESWPTIFLIGSTTIPG